MLTFFIHFGLSFRQVDHWLASRLFCPFPPPPLPPLHHSSCHFFNGPFLINNYQFWVFQERTSGARLVFLLSPPRGRSGGGGLFISSPFEGGGLIKTRGNGSLTTIFKITHPFPSKIRRLAAMQGKGGRKI